MELQAVDAFGAHVRILLIDLNAIGRSPTPPDNMGVRDLPVRWTRLIRLSCGVIAAGFLVGAGPEADRPLRERERTQIFETLQRGEEPTEAPLATFSDDALRSAVLRHALRETGQRLAPRRIDPAWGLAPEPRDVAAELQAALGQDRLADWLASLSPDDPDTRALEAAACRYREGGGWLSIPPGPTLRPGDGRPEWAQVRMRLQAEGAALPTPAGSEADAAMIMRFQADHGLVADGIIGPATRMALDVPVETRLAQIEANLERRRWMPRRLPARRLEVDVAGAEARLFDAGRPVLMMRIVVGDLAHKTPIFASRLEAVVLNPPWNVPSSIATAEILPRAARDPGYLARNGFRVVDGRLQQRPGPQNALGRFKFDLPSPYGVYLHDTPARSVFARTTRTLSHGCMRLEQPEALARWLLAQQGWTAAALSAATDTGETRRIVLADPLPLFVVYRTAFVAGDRLHFAPDVYGWDASLSRALAGAGAPASTGRPFSSECSKG